MSDAYSQQKVMAAIMLALKNSCECQSCILLRDVADSLIDAMKMPPQPTEAKPKSKPAPSDIAYKHPYKKE